MEPHSKNWTNFVTFAFILSVCATGAGIWFLPTDFWAKGYLGMGVMTSITMAIAITKTTRDNTEARKLSSSESLEK